MSVRPLTQQVCLNTFASLLSLFAMCPTIIEDCPPETVSFNREGRLVHDLIYPTASTKREFHIGTAQTWLDGFRIFRTLENKIGLPETPEERYGYFVLLGALFNAGKFILSKLQGQDEILYQFTGVSYAAFKGCVEQLKDSLKYYQRNMTEEEIQKLKGRIFEPDAKAVA